MTILVIAALLALAPFRPLRKEIMRNRLTFGMIVMSLAGVITASAQTTENFEVASVRSGDRPGGPQFGPCSGGVELTSGRIAINAATVFQNEGQKK